MFKGKVNWGGLGVLDIIDLQADLWRYAGPGHWNDPDMLEVGNGGMTNEEYKTHFSMWCMLAAPLMAGNDLRNMDDETLTLLTNAEAIAVNQDPLGKQAFRFLDRGEHEIWVKWLENDEFAVCFLNRSDLPWEKAYDWKILSIYHDGRAVEFGEKTYTIRDLWRHEKIGETDVPIDLSIPPHGVLLLRLSSK
jgi:alpha-galactosidase